MAKLERSWNSFVRSMIQTKDSWERLRLQLEERPNMDNIEPKAQKYLCQPFSRSTFFKAMPEFIRLFGYKRVDLRDLLVSESFKDKPKQTTKSKEKNNGGARQSV